MAWRYLARHWAKTAILVFSIALIAYIPAGLRVLVQRSETELRERAEATPLLVGAKGSPVELVLSSLYFAVDVPARFTYDEVERMGASGFAQPIPLYVRFRSQRDPIVGTSLEYLEFRGLRLAAGRPMTRLGDCVVGAEVARRRAIAPNDAVLSAPESVFDLAGVYPLKMRVTGVLEPSGTPDDQAIFVDVRTAWVIEGLAHGHEDLTRPEAVAGVLKREEGLVTANASVVQYNEITEENIESFHFHGVEGDFPITAILAVPPDHKSATLLRGRYETSERFQVLRPLEVMDDLLATVLTVQHVVVAALLCVSVATLATAILVFLLSLRLRRREIETMMKIGGARLRVASILGMEIVLVLTVGAGIAGALTWATARYGAELVQRVLMG
jgi:putative ABC transport system permease protein